MPDRPMATSVRYGRLTIIKFSPTPYASDLATLQQVAICCTRQQELLQSVVMVLNPVKPNESKVSASELPLQ